MNTDRYFQNKYTKEICKLKNIEEAESNPKNITVYILENGDRWHIEDLFKHWIEVYPMTDDKGKMSFH